MREERRQRARVEHTRAIGLELRRRYARREHHAEIHRETLRALEEEADPGHAEHVRELVRIADGGRRPERQDRTLEALGHQHRALEMHVSVDEAGHDVRALHVDRALRLKTGLDADDGAVADRDVAFAEHAREHVEVARVAEHEIARLLTLCRAKPLA
jgi:hypothetical protein